MAAMLVDRGVEGVVVGATVLRSVHAEIGRRLGIRPRAASAIVNGVHP